MTIFIPTPLRAYAAGQPSVEVEAATIAEALSSLTGSHPELRNHLFNAEGKLRAFVNLYLNDEDVRYLPAKEATSVTAADTLSIIPSIAGGTGRPGNRTFGTGTATGWIRRFPGLKIETWGTQRSWAKANTLTVRTNTLAKLIVNTRT
jgi:molybdopterin synthase sulfur carrier subunit